MPPLVLGSGDDAGLRRSAEGISIDSSGLRLVVGEGEGEDEGEDRERAAAELDPSLPSNERSAGGLISAEFSGEYF